jgi:hypothetical protein
VIRKIKDTPSGYPRREGMPQKRPLYFWNIFDNINIFLGKIMYILKYLKLSLK